MARREATPRGAEGTSEPREESDALFGVEATYGGYFRAEMNGI